MALDHAVSDGGPWYVEMTQLQLVSLQACSLVRRRFMAEMWVRDETPWSVWVAMMKDGYSSTTSRRFPRLQVYGVTWARESSVVDGLRWPTSLKKLTLGENFNQSLEGLI